MTPAEAVLAAEPTAIAILPPRASPIERALLTAEIARLALIDPAVVVSIWNAWKCPTALLPWLAQATSVDVWDPAWSEIVKRREIAASPGIHRIKGVRAAIELSLSRMGLAFEMTEWWETSPQARRGTFKVFIDAGADETLTSRASARARILSTKPKSRVFELKLGITEKGPLGIAAATQTRSIVVSENYVLDGVLEEVGPLGVAVALVTRSIITSEAA